MNYSIENYLDKLSRSTQEEWHGGGFYVVNRLLPEQRAGLDNLFASHRGAVAATIHAYGDSEDLGQGKPTPRERMLAALLWMKDRKPKVQVMLRPVNVWLYRPEHEGWFATVHKPGLSRRFGPYKLVPGMMGLDELMSHRLYIGPRDEGKWYVYRDPGLVVVDDGFNTALEAQWAATCLAKEGAA